MRARADLTGRQFGRLTVIAYAVQRRAGSGKPLHFWRCRCACGVVSEVLGVSLTRAVKPTRSCGCLSAEAGRRNGLHRKGRRSVSGSGGLLSADWDSL